MQHLDYHLYKYEVKDRHYFGMIAQNCNNLLSLKYFEDIVTTEKPFIKIALSCVFFITTIEKPFHESCIFCAIIFHHDNRETVLSKLHIFVQLLIIAATEKPFYVTKSCNGNMVTEK